MFILRDRNLVVFLFLYQGYRLVQQSLKEAKDRVLQAWPMRC